MKYKIIDVCEENSTFNYKDDKGEFTVELDTYISLELFQRALMCEILAYAECYDYDGEEIRDQFMQNMTELLMGENIQINGMEYIVEKE